MHIEAGTMEQLGRALLAARQEQGLRQDELARAVGVSARTVHAIEHGKVTVRADVLLRVIEGLGYELLLQPRRPSSHGERSQS